MAISGGNESGMEPRERGVPMLTAPKRSREYNKVVLRLSPAKLAKNGAICPLSGGV